MAHKKVVVQINATCGKGSTGKICQLISDLLIEKGFISYVAYSLGNSNYPNSFKYSNPFLIKLNTVLSRITGLYGFVSWASTHNLIKWLKIVKPDIVHIHNIHSHSINLTTFFRFIKKNNIKVVYTFHDTWAFTGYCVYYTFCCCEKFTKECSRCPQYRKYSWFFDKSKKLFNLKKQAYQGANITIVTPSTWLSKEVRKSQFFANSNIKVINNGIDLNIFKPTNTRYKAGNNLLDKYIVLGVSSEWEFRKGLDVFIELSKRLTDKYQIVLVGIKSKNKIELPRNIIALEKTNNQNVLAEIYSSADVFVNPTREENYPTVNMEALACGTPVLTFRTGGSPEIIDETCGSVVDVDDIDSLEKEIIRICETKPYSKEACLERAKLFDMNDRFKEYIDLYKELSGNQ